MGAGGGPAQPNHENLVCPTGISGWNAASSSAFLLIGATGAAELCSTFASIGDFTAISADSTIINYRVQLIDKFVRLVHLSSVIWHTLAT